ncbi:glycosyltransferase [Candidatus Uhrbacteria bacterium]|nr:glycosyltransferase [Candidatus Uhrbacteria bacterium]
MRLLYVQNANLPTEWAHGYQIVKTCEALAKAGLEVELVLPRRGNPERKKRSLFEYYGIEPCFKVRWLPVFDLVPYMPFALERIPYVLERWTFLRGVARFLRLVPRDGTVCYTRDPAVAETLLASGLPTVMEVHDDPRTNRSRWERIKTRVAGWVVISRALEELLVEEGIDRARVCVAPDAYDAKELANLPSRSAARAELDIPEDVTLFVYLGQLLRWKGVDGIAPAFRQVPDGTQIAIVGGEAPDRERVVAAVGGEMVRTSLLPRVDRRGVLTWLAAADAAILPTSANFEIGRSFTSPLKLFEYLAAGLPVIASDVPSSREVLEESTALFFKPDSPQDFLDAMNRFRSRSPDDRTHMAAEAKRRAETFTWQNRGKRISDALRQLW